MFLVADNDGFKDLKYIGDNTLFPGDSVYVLSGELLKEPTRISIQIGPDEHIEDEWGQYVNHSCDPSVKIVNNQLIAVKQIEKGDSITFDYNVSEDHMSNPFYCNCCNKLIKGKN